MTTKQTTLRRINKDLGNEIPTYNLEIPLGEIFSIVEAHDGKVVDEAGEAWSGLLCGASGQANMEIKHPDHKNMWLRLSWYKMDSGRYEIVVYAGI